jgi:hypothetical protein
MKFKKRFYAKPATNYGFRQYRSSDDNYTGEDCDAARDSYRDNGGYPVTRQDIEDAKAWDEECRRNRW